VLAEIGEKAGVQVTDDEMQRALVETIRRYPQNQQQQVYEHFRNNPGALANIRAPLFEEKVVDHLMNEVKVTDQKVTRDELMADDEDEAETKADASDDKKAAKKKAPAKKKAAKKDEAEDTAEA
jgi:trigger factor